MYDRAAVILVILVPVTQNLGRACPCLTVVFCVFSGIRRACSCKHTMDAGARRSVVSVRPLLLAVCVSLKFNFGFPSVCACGTCTILLYTCEVTPTYRWPFVLATTSKILHFSGAGSL